MQEAAATLVHRLELSVILGAITWIVTPSGAVVFFAGFTSGAAAHYLYTRYGNR